MRIFHHYQYRYFTLMVLTLALSVPDIHFSCVPHSNINRTARMKDVFSTCSNARAKLYFSTPSKISKANR